MNRTLASLRDRLPRRGQHARRKPATEGDAARALQLTMADLLLTTGIGTWLESRRSGRAAAAADSLRIGRWREARPTRPLTWAPALLGCAGAAAHLVHALTPTARTRMAVRTFDTAAVAAGILAFTDGVASPDHRRSNLPVASLSLASAGLAGLFLDRAEIQDHAERARLERRARLVERLVPQRRPRFDRLVVHI